ncbi:MAG TPA: XRE family transcriptional regulator [Deltaproteobacteria bacterium]|nr:XRE family transcriptional regulator [Candidatus Binatota bacterium]HIL12065.1 XRE family transcriptional regulator [Deltaproteobacteria bacterium]
MAANSSLENRLGEISKDRRLTLVDLSDLTGISYSTVRRMVVEGTDPPLGNALSMSRVLGLPLRELYCIATAHEELVALGKVGLAFDGPLLAAGVAGAGLYMNGAGSAGDC